MSKHQSLLKTITFSFLLILLSSCAVKVKQPKKIEYLSYITAGEDFPLTELTDIKGNKLDLSNPNKRKLVILFATWCSDSQRALTALSKSEILNHQDLEIVTIGREETIEKLEKFQKERSFNYTMVADPKREIYSQFANAGIPRFITIGKDNKIIGHIIAEGENQLDKIVWNK